MDQKPADDLNTTPVTPASDDSSTPPVEQTPVDTTVTETTTTPAASFPTDTSAGPTPPASPPTPPEDIPSPPQRKGSPNMVAAVLGMVILVAGLAAGLLLVKRSQDIRQRAAAPPQPPTTACWCTDIDPQHSQCPQGWQFCTPNNPPDYCPTGQACCYDPNVGQPPQCQGPRPSPSGGIDCILTNSNPNSCGNGTKTLTVSGTNCTGYKLKKHSKYITRPEERDCLADQIYEGEVDLVPGNTYTADPNEPCKCVQKDVWVNGVYQGGNDIAECGPLGPACNGAGPTPTPGTTPRPTPTPTPRPTPTPGSTPVPTPGPTPPAPSPIAVCRQVNIYKVIGGVGEARNWRLLTSAELTQLRPGDIIYATTKGTNTYGNVDKARIRVNSSVWTAGNETTNIKPGSYEIGGFSLVNVNAAPDNQYQQRVLSQDGATIYYRYFQNGNWQNWNSAGAETLTGLATIRSVSQTLSPSNEIVQQVLSGDGSIIRSRFYRNDAWTAWTETSVASLGISGVTSLLAFDQTVITGGVVQHALLNDGQTVYTRSYGNGSWGSWSSYNVQTAYGISQIRSLSLARTNPAGQNMDFVTNASGSQIRNRQIPGSWTDVPVAGPNGIGIPGTEFYISYTIPTGTTTFTFEAEIHEQILNRWY